MLLKKFRGCLLGSLVGDCLGYPFEAEAVIYTPQLQKYFDKFEGPPFQSPFYKYTDDTAMIRSVSYSLLQNIEFNPKDIALRLVKQYFEDHNRGYGESITNVFIKLKNQNFDNICKPAEELFNGSGSHSNDGATRIAPVSLFYYNDYHQMIENCKKVTKITNTHTLGINGALLQAIAINQCLSLDPDNPLDTTDFIKHVLQKITLIEDNLSCVIPEKLTYKNQVEEVGKLIGCGNDVSSHKVIECLGNNISAIYSVPTALYCFLRCQQSIPEIMTNDPFRRIIQFAISLGGDTDTIASMAGAIAGAYYGIDGINKNFINMCEDSQTINQLAIQLHNAIHPPT